MIFSEEEHFRNRTIFEGSRNLVDNFGMKKEETSRILKQVRLSDKNVFLNVKNGLWISGKYLLKLNVLLSRGFEKIWIQISSFRFKTRNRRSTKDHYSIPR